MARVKVCRLCGTHNAPDELFCIDCGTSLADVRATDTAEPEVPNVEADADSDSAPTPATPMPAPADGGGRTVREPSAPACALLFPWGRMPVVGQLGIGREAGFSPISQQLDAYPKISRRHAVISIAQGRWTVHDLGSTNGTYVNGAKLAHGETRTVSNGDLLGFSRGLQVQVEIGTE